VTVATPVASRLAVGGASLYEHLGAGDRYMHITRDDAFLALLRRHGFDSLGPLRILELGCGEGSFLRTLIAHGANSALLQGMDVDARRLRLACKTAAVALAAVGALPYADGAFDLAVAFTVFSSVLDPETRRLGANEAMRTLRPGGLLVAYDFAVNPTNRSVRPVGAAELRALFAPRTVEIERVTLAPPLARALAGRPALCRPLERLPFLRTHLLAAVRKEGP
jgi:SAM-dependent methyltransferase